MELYHETVQDTSGNIVNGATVTVYDDDTGLPATLYKADGVTALSNPFLSGYAYSEGEIDFKAVTGTYSIKVQVGAETDWIYSQSLITVIRGTYAPVLTFGGASTGITYSTQSASYTQIANIVHVLGRLILTSKGTPTGDAEITLPSALGTPALTGGQTTATIRLAILSGTLAGVDGRIATGSYSVLLRKNGNSTGAGTTIQDTDFTDTSTIIFNASYTV